MQSIKGKLLVVMQQLLYCWRSAHGADPLWLDLCSDSWLHFHSLQSRCSCGVGYPHLLFLSSPYVALLCVRIPTPCQIITVFFWREERLMRFQRPCQIVEVSGPISLLGDEWINSLRHSKRTYSIITRYIYS